MQKLVSRHAEGAVREALRDTRVVMIHGPRQAGKSTLARAIAEGDHTARIATLDEDRTLAAARADPVTFVEHEGLLVIDEVQRAPELFRAIKAHVDREPRPGAFLLTGSTSALAVPRLADALVGRMEVVELQPFSRGEMIGRMERFVDELLSGGEGLRTESTLERADYVEAALAGGFPEAVERTGARRRERWFDAYVATVVQREVREAVEVSRLAELPRILRLVAARTGGPLNIEALSRDADVPPSSLRRYLALLEATFLLWRLPAWSGGRTRRLARAPKLLVGDSGLTAHLIYVGPSAVNDPVSGIGPLIETFVIGELRRQLGWAEERATLHFLRTKEGVELDVVVEAADGRVAGVEIKAGVTVGQADFAGLRHLRRRAGDRFVGGVVLYTGREPLSFGGGLWAVPMSTLWDCAR